MTQGKFIVIEGTDGSGKGTQVKLLSEKLQSLNIPFQVTDFPQYGTPSAYFVEKYLRGEYGTAQEVGPYKASYFYALDRFDKSFEMKKWLSEGTHIISNRFVTSSMGHQTGKIESREEQDIFLDWLDRLEYEELGVPRPDVVVFLYVPPATAQKLVGEKAAREYTKGKSHDIHEADLGHLEKAAAAYKYVAEKFGWLCIDCVRDGVMMSPEEINTLIFEKISDYFKTG
jgi:dTMP kinase